MRTRIGPGHKLGQVSLVSGSRADTPYGFSQRPGHGVFSVAVAVSVAVADGAVRVADAGMRRQHVLQRGVPGAARGARLRASLHTHLARRAQVSGN